MESIFCFTPYLGPFLAALFAKNLANAILFAAAFAFLSAFFVSRLRAVAPCFSRRANDSAAAFSSLAIRSVDDVLRRGGEGV